MSMSRVGTWFKYAAVATAVVFAGTAAAEEQVIRLSEPVEQTEDYETFGAPLDQSVSIVELGEIASDGERFAATTVRVVARVAKVCQKKGCFFIAQDGDAVMRVSFKDYGFFVPTDSGGKRVVLVGEVIARDVTADEAAHYADDLGGGDSPVTPGKSYEIVATSVRVPRG